MSQHPCETRCFRVGRAADLDENGTCIECGMPMPKATRWPRTRLLEIEEAAKNLMAFHDEYVWDVLDHFSKSVKDSGEWTDVVEAMRTALRQED